MLKSKLLKSKEIKSMELKSIQCPEFRRSDYGPALLSIALVYHNSDRYLGAMHGMNQNMKLPSVGVEL